MPRNRKGDEQLRVEHWSRIQPQVQELESLSRGMGMPSDPYGRAYDQFARSPKDLTDPREVRMAAMLDAGQIPTGNRLNNPVARAQGRLLESAFGPDAIADLGDRAYGAVYGPGLVRDRLINSAAELAGAAPGFSWQDAATAAGAPGLVVGVADAATDPFNYFFPSVFAGPARAASARRLGRFAIPAELVDSHTGEVIKRLRPAMPPRRRAAVSPVGGLLGP